MHCRARSLRLKPTFNRFHPFHYPISTHVQWLHPGTRHYVHSMAMANPFAECEPSRAEEYR